ncbi:DUF1707 domain-containing protein [Actinopolymorpha sp. B17G11]|uniref:DUF1707 SHOCT-like domain-containing protein n=1 Tax=Actinopolymorpha sp. B17G11 TaxID=3160861 RepID=UPI0032E4E230
MTNLPEPVHPRAHLRASDADRERVVQLLGEALADGRLETHEHSERLDAVYTAKTLGELVPLTHDLSDVVETPGADSQARARSPVIDQAGASTETDHLIGIFGGGERKGRWRVRRRTNAVAVFGGFDLDMTEATFDARRVEIRLFALFGGISITIPDGVEVQNQCGGVLGGVSINTGDTPPPPGAPVIVLKGVAIFGGGDIHVRRK